MSKNEMTCPHCDEQPAVFETEEPVTITPTIENWKFDEPMDQLATKHNLLFVCIDCNGKVTINPTRREIVKVGEIPKPLWNDEMEDLLAALRLRLPQDPLPARLLHVANANNYQLEEKLTNKEAIQKIVLSKP